MVDANTSITWSLRRSIRKPVMLVMILEMRFNGFLESLQLLCRQDTRVHLQHIRQEVGCRLDLELHDTEEFDRDCKVTNITEETAAETLFTKKESRWWWSSWRCSWGQELRRKLCICRCSSSYWYYSSNALSRSGSGKLRTISGDDDDQGLKEVTKGRSSWLLWRHRPFDNDSRVCCWMTIVSAMKSAFKIESKSRGGLLFYSGFGIQLLCVLISKK